MRAVLEQHRVGALYALFYGGQFILLGVQLPFFAGWLDGRGFAASEIGLITGAALVARLLFGPAVAFWADHQDDERLSLRVVTFFFAAAAACLVVADGTLTATAVCITARRARRARCFFSRPPSPAARS